MYTRLTMYLIDAWLFFFEVFKPGECPQLAVYQSDCAEQCRTDADCVGDDKCCYNGCGTFCLRPQQSTSTTTLSTTTAIMQEKGIYIYIYT